MLLNLVVFITGAVVMVVELTGSRIIAPYAGTSLTIWTNLIGILLGCLSLGYFFGGKLADSHPTKNRLGTLLLIASFFLSFIPLLNKFFLPLLFKSFLDYRFLAGVSTFLLFGVPSILLGMVSPYVLKLSLTSTTRSGTTAGTLYALATVGSIVGTFLAGYVLIAWIGSDLIFFLLAVCMLLLSLCLLARRRIVVLSCAIFLGSMIGIIYSTPFLPFIQQPILSEDTPYSHVIIDITNDWITGKPVRELKLNDVHDSAIFLNGKDLVYPYTKYYRLADNFVPNIQRALMIGGGGYTYPEEFIHTHPSAKMDIVEIDPELTELAEQYFGFRPTPNTTIYNEDGRTFLNREPYQYDAIFLDAFAGYTTPFQLTTKEALIHLSDMLSLNGVIISNTVSPILGSGGKLFQSEYATYKAVFPFVAVFPVTYPDDGYALQNVMIVASKNTLPLTTANTKYQSYLQTRWQKNIPSDVPLLTDDYAPVEYYTVSMLDQSR